MKQQRPVLGKGLASLLPGAGAPLMGSLPGSDVPPTNSSNSGPNVAAGASAAGSAELANRDRVPGITFATLEDITTNQYQPRREFEDESIRELADSIRANGIIQPLVVRKGTYGYQLIAGERRLRAAKLAGLKQVPVVVRKSTDREALEIALVENVQRQNLNCVDEALAYLQLMQDFSLTQEDVAERMGKDRATVANFIRLLRLPEAVIDDLKRGVLSFGHGRALLGIEDNDARLMARKRIIDEKLSVRATEQLVDELKKKLASGSTGNNSETAAQKVQELTPIQSRLKNLSLEFTRSLGSRTEVKGSDRKGKIVIQYGNRTELDRLIGLMQNLK